MITSPILRSLSEFIRLRAENHGCKPVDVRLRLYGLRRMRRSTKVRRRKCEQLALRRMSLERVEGGPAVAKRRRVNIGTTAIKPWGSIKRVIIYLANEQ